MLTTIIPNELEYQAADKWEGKRRAEELVRNGGTQIIHWTLTDELWPPMEPTPVWAVWVRGCSVGNLFTDRWAAFDALAAALRDAPRT